MRPLLFLLCLSGWMNAAAQQHYTPLRPAWHLAGYPGAKPRFTKSIDIRDYGADAGGKASCNAALTDAIGALGGSPGVILFPPGTYAFDAAVSIARDSIVLRGAGYDSTTLLFDLGHKAHNCISIAGSVTSDTALLTSPAIRGNYSVSISNAAAFRPGDWVALTMADAAYMTSAWAHGSFSQTAQITAVHGDTVIFSSPFRAHYALVNSPRIRRILPRCNVGIECLKMRRMDSVATQASNIVFDRAVGCWVSGIESHTAGFAHIEINRSSNVEVTTSWLHDAFAYGGGGQAYGVLLQFGSGECKVEANYFDHLRHSMVLQAGANGNVLAGNYSTHPFWTEPGLPDSAAGDIVLHGNYPFMNLAEGNIVRNIVIDDSHGANGPHNTFFRNRAEGYGIFMNFRPATDSVQFIGNEITNMQVGMNFIQGAGHFLWGNNYRGALTSGSAAIPDTSLYLPPSAGPLCAAGYDAWPVAGRPGGYDKGSNYAKARVLAGKPAACACEATKPLPARIPAVGGEGDWKIYPNPARDNFSIAGPQASRVELYNIAGRLVLSQATSGGAAISIRDLAPGLYRVRIVGRQQVATYPLVIGGR